VRRMNGRKVVAVRRGWEVELSLFALDLALGFVVAFGMEVEEVGFILEVGKDETVDLVETYGKYGDNRSSNGLVFWFVGVGAGRGNVKVNGPSISSCLLSKGVTEGGDCDIIVDSVSAGRAGYRPPSTGVGKQDVRPGTVKSSNPHSTTEPHCRCNIINKVWGSTETKGVKTTPRS